MQPRRCGIPLTEVDPWAKITCTARISPAAAPRVSIWGGESLKKQVLSILWRSQEPRALSSDKHTQMIVSVDKGETEETGSKEAEFRILLQSAILELESDLSRRIAHGRVDQVGVECPRHLEGASNEH